MENNLDDVQIILDFIDYLQETFKDVLSDTGYLIGHSNGAFLSSQIILTNPNRIQGAVLFAGHVYEFPETEPGDHIAPPKNSNIFIFFEFYEFKRC